VFHPRRIPASGVPAVLIVEGSGKSPDRKDSAVSPFYQLGRILARDGYYVLTYNKRGSGSNTGNGSFYRSGFWMDNKDAQAALDFLSSAAHIDKSRIFLLGQSMGGVHITFLARKNRVAGNIYFAAAFKEFKETLRQQNADILGFLGKSRRAIALELKKIAKMLHAIETGNFCASDYTDICRKIEGANIIDGVQERYFREVLKIDSARELAKLDIPLLILQGTSDFVINLNDLQAAKNALRKAGEKNARLKILPKVDHIFSDQPDKAASFKYMVKIGKTGRFKPVSKKALHEIREFLSAHNKT
jgi:hypothetical protein